MSQNDTELVLLAKAGQNDRAFAELVKRHQAPLRSFLTRLCADPTLADDIAQNSFLKAHRAISSFQSGRSFRSWLYAIAYREFLQHRRKDVAARRLEDALAAEGKIHDQSGAAVSTELSIDLQRALLTLSEEERAAILLCDAVGLSHSEASGTLNLPLGSIKTYVARARQKMRDALANPEAGAATAPIPSANSKPKLNGVHYAI